MMNAQPTMLKGENDLEGASEKFLLKYQKAFNFIYCSKIILMNVILPVVNFILEKAKFMHLY